MTIALDSRSNNPTSNLNKRGWTESRRLTGRSIIHKCIDARFNDNAKCNQGLNNWAKDSVTKTHYQKQNILYKNTHFKSVSLKIVKLCSHFAKIDNYYLYKYFSYCRFVSFIDIVAVVKIVYRIYDCTSGLFAGAGLAAEFLVARSQIITEYPCLSLSGNCKQNNKEKRQ